MMPRVQNGSAGLPGRPSSQQSWLLSGTAMCAEPTKRGRRTGGRYAPTSISLSSELRKRVDAWAAKQSDKPARSEAILRLVELGLEATQQKGSLANRAAKA
jgi:hypothetical protein